MHHALLGTGQLKRQVTMEKSIKRVTDTIEHIAAILPSLVTRVP